MAKAELRYFAQGQASIVPPLSSKLLCRRPWRGQTPPDTFPLAEYNMLMPRDFSPTMRPQHCYGCCGCGGVCCRYSLHEIDRHDVVATTVAADRDEALEWFSKKLRLMLSFEGDPGSADYLLEEWAESLPYLAHTPKPTIPVFVVRAMAAHSQASQGAGCGYSSA